MNESLVFEALKNSPAGRLQYDRNGLTNGNLQEIPGKFASTPKMKIQNELCKQSQTNSASLQTDENCNAENPRVSGAVSEKSCVVIKKSPRSPGFSYSDFDKQIIALRKDKKRDDAEIRDLALRYSENYLQRFDQFSQMIAQRTEEHWRHLCNKKKRNIEQFAQQKEQEHKTGLEDLIKRSQQKIREYQHEDELLKKNVIDAVKKHEEKDRKREQQNKEQINKLQEVLKEVLKSKEYYLEMVNQYDSNLAISESVHTQVEIITSVAQQVEDMLNALKSRPCGSYNVKELTDCVSRTQNIVENIKIHVAEAEKKYREMQATKEKQNQEREGEKHSTQASKNQEISAHMGSQQQQQQLPAVPSNSEQQSRAQIDSKQPSENKAQNQQQPQQKAGAQTGSQQQQLSVLCAENQLHHQQQQQPPPQPADHHQHSSVKQDQLEQQDIGHQPAVANSSSASNEAPKIILNSVFKETHGHYLKLINIQKDKAKVFQALVSNSKMKKYRFDLQKAVNTLINTISASSGRQLCDKLNQIKDLLSGSPVTVCSKTVCARDNAGGLEFCRDLFAKKLVSQGETQVASQPESAFVFASVAVGVWYEIPEVGDLILAYFYLTCPYLVPYYVPKQENQTNEDYYKLLGYTYENGHCEQQDHFLRRMSGLMHFYAAIIVSAPPNIRCHPYGLDKAWSWITQLIHLDPRPDITATLMYDFFEVTAYFLAQVYKKQFHKLLGAIIKEYMPKVRKAKAGCSDGPVVRLESYLKKIKAGHVTQPDGYPSQQFWSS